MCYKKNCIQLRDSFYILLNMRYPAFKNLNTGYYNSVTINKNCNINNYFLNILELEYLYIYPLMVVLLYFGFLLF